MPKLNNVMIIGVLIGNTIHVKEGVLLRVTLFFYLNVHRPQLQKGPRIGPKKEVFSRKVSLTECLKGANFLLNRD